MCDLIDFQCYDILPADSLKSTCLTTLLSGWSSRREDDEWESRVCVFACSAVFLTLHVNVYVGLLVKHNV